MRIHILALLCIAVSYPASAQVYRWVDDNGVVHYGDRVPPKYAKKKRDIINESGIAVDSLEREKTPEEIKAAKAEAKAQKQAEEAAKEQVRYDRFLVGTYETVSDILDARDDRMTTIDSRIGITEKIIRDTEESVAMLQKQAKSYTDKQQTPPDDIKKQLADFDSNLVSNLKALQRLRQERSDTLAKYTRDVERFKALKGQ